VVASDCFQARRVAFLEEQIAERLLETVRYLRSVTRKAYTIKSAEGKSRVAPEAVQEEALGEKLALALG
jgi:hypothetical protein